MIIMGTSKVEEHEAGVRRHYPAQLCIHRLPGVRLAEIWGQQHVPLGVSTVSYVKCRNALGSFRRKALWVVIPQQCPHTG